MMNNYYNNFEALDRDEYEELMSDLYGESAMQEEVADEAAKDYFMNEITKDANTHTARAARTTGRYQLILVFDDLSGKSERSDDFGSVLRAAEIYVMDPACVIISIYDRQEDKEILDWSR